MLRRLVDRSHRIAELRAPATGVALKVVVSVAGGTVGWLISQL